jgi:hypothetical protein
MKLKHVRPLAASVTLPAGGPQGRGRIALGDPGEGALLGG